MVMLLRHRLLKATFSRESSYYQTAFIHKRDAVSKLTSAFNFSFHSIGANSQTGSSAKLAKIVCFNWVGYWH
jgi:hypothetical protein